MREQRGNTMKKLIVDGKWLWLDERMGEIRGKCDAPTDEERAAIDADRERASAIIADKYPQGLPFNERCPYCGDQQCAEQFSKRCRVCDLVLVSPNAKPAAPAVPRPPPGCKEYKVITQRDEFFASKFNPAALQDALNVHAAQGWHVVSLTTTDVGSFVGSFWAKGGGSSRQELVVLLERTVEAEVARTAA
jgi:hypothetical protein